MAKNEGKDMMGYVTSKWLYKQTMADGYSNHWYDLVTDVLSLKQSSKARLVGGEWCFPTDAVKKVLAVPPYELQDILNKRG